MTAVMTARKAEALLIRVRGVVQGVGFRPFVYRLARQTELSGWVRNDAAGVLIHVEGSGDRLERFRELLLGQVPAAAIISGVACVQAVPAGHTTFRILPSQGAEGREGAVRVPPDRARCELCRHEVFDPADRRWGYPFTTCTECGPRYSIIRRMPYDRLETGMARFPLCPDCKCEYGSPECRRFHAQPIACHACGPLAWLRDGEGRTVRHGDEAIRRAAVQLRAGRVVALKGLGGFQLLVRADSSEAVNVLRRRKGRPTKPLAVMVPDVPTAQRLVRLGAEERQLLESPENPIVLLDRIPGTEALLAPEVAPRLGWVGLMLPTTPLHDLVLAELDLPVVATSGNLSEEPIEMDNDSAIARLIGIADVFLVHDRPIERRVDDSVVRVAAGGPVKMRLARGYAPLPLPALERWLERRPALPAPVLAVGGQQKSAVALWTGTQAVLSPHVGDLDGPETRAAFRRLTAELADLYGCRAELIACDLHPDYFSTRWAEGQGRPMLRVQHHHAHAAAVMTEHGLLDEEVLAFTWDGTGYGPDGTVWGGEALRARVDGYERVASLRPFPLPGGEAAVHEPARVALGMLAAALGEQAVLGDTELIGSLGLRLDEAKLLLRMILRNVNTPWTSSMGRLFDAVAALLLPVGRVSYEGEAAAWLESLADGSVGVGYALASDASGRADWSGLVRAVLHDRRRGVPAPVIAGRFHQAVASWASGVAARQPGLPVVLGGGCFQNRLLLEKTRAGLEATGRRVYHAGSVPPGDGGLAVGQLAVALATCSFDRGDG
jgi:hydrogenase maturation protein HypF